MRIYADPMGESIAEYWQKGKAERLRVFSPLFDEDEIPVEWLFRQLSDMPSIEQKAIELARGKTLDVGAGAGCHALALQERGVAVTAIDISELSVKTMRERGVQHAIKQDFFTVTDKYDTILMLMNGIGIVGTLDRLSTFFNHTNRILAPGGQVLCDSSDLRYVFENEDGVIDAPYPNRYYGELSYHMQYRQTIGNQFNWLYIDPKTLTIFAQRHGFKVDIVAEGDNYDFLARISRR